MARQAMRSINPDLTLCCSILISAHKYSKVCILNSGSFWVEVLHNVMISTNILSFTDINHLIIGRAQDIRYR